MILMDTGLRVSVLQPVDASRYVTHDVAPEACSPIPCIKPSIMKHSSSGKRSWIHQTKSEDQKSEDQIMSTKLKVTIIASSLAILLFTVVGGFVNVRASSNEGAYRQLSVYSEVLSRIRLEYVEEPNIAGVTEGALHGLLESLDANSSYLSADEYKRYKTMKNDGKADIGATVSKRFGYAAVVAVIPGGPAEKAGVENSDIIESIEGKSTHDMSLAEIHGLLSGEVGSTITVAVVRPRRAEPQKIVITRDVVAIPPVSEKMLADNVGYIQVDAFPEGKSQEIAAKIRDLQKQGAKKLVLDLRNSASGEESEGVATANLFLDHGTITYLQGQKYPRAGFQRRSCQGHHQAAGGGAGKSWNGGSSRDGRGSHNRRLSLFVGGGIVPSFEFAVQDGFNTGGYFEPTVGLVAQAGADYMFNRNWGVFLDVKKLFIWSTGKSTEFRFRSPDRHYSRTPRSKTTFQPWLFSTGVTCRF